MKKKGWTGVTKEEVLSRATSWSGFDWREAGFSSCRAMVDHCLDQAPGFEETMLQQPIFPAINRTTGHMNLTVPMKNSTMRKMFSDDLARPLGFREYSSGIYSLRKFSINKVLGESGGNIWLAGSHASHKPSVDGATIRHHYKGNNANQDLGSFMQGRGRVPMLTRADSPAMCRVPEINSYR